MREPVTVLLALVACVALGAPAHAAEDDARPRPLDRRTWCRPSAWLTAAAPTTGSEGSIAYVRHGARPCPSCAGPRPYWYRSYLRPTDARGGLSLAASALVGVGGAGLLLAGDEAAVERLSDLGEVALTGLGFGVPAAHGDGPGFVQFGLSYVGTMRLVSLAKDQLAVLRPDGTSRDSFPSAHTASAFAAAATLHTRYGPDWGIPCYTLATLVAGTRLQLDRHRLTDVVAGAGIGMLTSWATAIPFGGECHERTRFGLDPRWRMEFAYGAVLRASNEVRAPACCGTSLDLARQAGRETAFPFSRFTLRYRLHPRTDLTLRIDPLEIVDVQTFGAPVRFDGVQLAPGTGFHTRWTANRLLLGADRRMTRHGRPWQARAGLGIAWASFEARLEGPDGVGYATHREAMLWPRVSASYELVPRLHARIALEAGLGLSSRGYGVELGLRWNVTPRWDLGVGARVNGYRIDAPDLRSDSEMHTLFLAIGRSF